jgi:hypothetical protein
MIRLADAVQFIHNDGSELGNAGAVESQGNSAQVQVFFDQS